MDLNDAPLLLPIARPADPANSVRSVLNLHGVAVVQDVIPAADALAFGLTAKRSLGEIFVDPRENVQHDDPATIARFKKLRAHHGGLLQSFGLSMTQACFDLRTREEVVRVFQHLWGTDYLVGSFDGVCIAPPPEAISAKCHLQTAENTWWHTDQRPPSNFACVQAFVNCFPTNEDSATLSVLEGSQAHHAAFFEHFDVKPDSDWYKLLPEHVTWFNERGCTWKRIGPLGPGDMVLWDSRTIHMGTLPLAGRMDRLQARMSVPVNPARHFEWRVVLYVCYTPCTWSDAKDYAKKNQAFREGRATAHWPYGGIKLFSAQPRTFGIPFPATRPYVPAVLDERQKCLMGLTPYPTLLQASRLYPPAPIRKLPRKPAAAASVSRVPKAAKKLVRKA